MAPIAKDHLEQLCRDALNRVRRIRPVRSVILGRSAVGNVNWTLLEVEPRFDVGDVRQSHAVIRDLQSKFRMVV
jgi:hypothetical protein